MLFVEKNLPKPLDDKEILEYFIRFQNGDLKSREIIISHNIKLVLYRVTGKFSSYPYDKDELVSIGLMGLIKAVDTFDKNKEVKFSTYAMKCIDNEILLFIRKNKTHKKHVSLTSPISTNKDGSELFLKDILRDSDEDFVSSIEEKELYDEVRRVIENLPEREKQIIMLYFGFNCEPLNQNEISSQMKISQSSVSKIITATLKTIKLQLENNEFQNKRRLKPIYEYFSDFSKEEIDNMLSQLNENEKKLVRMRYSDDLEHPVTDPSWTRENSYIFYRFLVPKMKRLLKNTTKPIYKNRKLKTIYELFSDFSKDEIDNMLSQLNEDEKELVRMRYGDDLEHPVTDPSWSKENAYSFYGILISKMKRKLQNKRKCDETNKEKCDNNYYEGEPNLTFSLDDYKKIKKLLNASYIDSLANNLSISKIETMIILLKRMILNGKKLSNETIANLLEIDVNDVESAISKITEMSDNDDEFSMKLKFN